MTRSFYRRNLRKLCLIGGAGALLTGASTSCPFQGILGLGVGQQGTQDTDGDGWTDSQELAAGTDSFNPLSHP